MAKVRKPFHLDIFHKIILTFLSFNSKFSGNTNIYEVNIRQYTPEGTFKAFEAHLPRLKAMGVEILWLMPIHPIGALNRKGGLGSYYAVRDFNAVNPEFGSTEDFRNMVSSIHKLGMKVILDWVANHAAWDNVWTIVHPEFFVRSAEGEFMPPFDWTDVIQIDHAHGGQQQAMTDAMKGWIKDFDIDGFRADLAHLTPLSFWINARKKTEAIKSNLIWLAETEDISYHEAFDISFTWNWMHACENVCRHESQVNMLADVLKSYHTDFPTNAFRLFFTSNHDENTWNGTEYEKYGQFASLLTIFSFTYTSIPLLYSGQELPNLRRLPFFEKDALDWSGEVSLYEFYKKLYSLRKSHAALLENHSGIEVPLFVINEHVLLYYRSHANHLLLVVMNFGNDITEARFENEVCYGSFEDYFTGLQFELNGSLELVIQPGSCFLLINK